MPKSPYPLASLKETAIPLDVWKPISSRLLSFTDVTMGTPWTLLPESLYLFQVLDAPVALCFESTPISLAQAIGAAFSPNTILLSPSAGTLGYVLQAPGAYLSAVALASGSSGKVLVSELTKWDALATATQLSFG